MKHKAFSIRDSKTGVFNPPFWTPHTGQAMRTLQELANDSKTQIGKYPEDFQLYEIGEYDDELGLMYPREAPHQIATAGELVNRAQVPRLSAATAGEMML